MVIGGIWESYFIIRLPVNMGSRSWFALPELKCGVVLARGPSWTWEFELIQRLVWFMAASLTYLTSDEE
jgi:hypothetical protein